MASRFGRLSLGAVLAAVLGALGYLYAFGTTIEPGVQAAKSGVVLDAQTRQPLAGVYVIARALAQTTESGKTEGQCVFRSVALTDGEGRYSIPATDESFSIARNWLPQRTRSYSWDLYTYSPDHGSVAATDKHPQSSNESTRTLQPILLARQDASPELRAKALTKTLAHFACEPFSRVRLPVEQDIYAEAYATACLQTSNDSARSTQSCAMLKQASKTAVGPSETSLQ